MKNWPRMVAAVTAVVVMSAAWGGVWAAMPMDLGAGPGAAGSKTAARKTTSRKVGKFSRAKARTKAAHKPARRSKSAKVNKAAARKTITPAPPAPLVETTPIEYRLAWQIALDRVGFSPGVIDGHPRAKTALATREFQVSIGLPSTGQLDQPTAAALGVNEAGAIRTYTVSQEDLSQVGPLPSTWIEKSKVSRLPYPSLDQALAERFHCSRALLAELNPGMDLAHLPAGAVIRAPAVEAYGRFSPSADVAVINVNFSQKAIRLYSSPDGGRCVGLVHCSIAKDKAKLPSGKARVAVISPNPTYGFDPAMWPEVKGVTHKLIIPPGPRNPVGLCWVGLSLKGYGIHGTPNPELIGKTGSHGCIRLANWDAVRLGKTVKVGTPVTFSM